MVCIVGQGVMAVHDRGSAGAPSIATGQNATNDAAIFISLGQRLIEDMTLRGFSEKTQHGYIRIVSPDRATAEDA